MQIINHRKATSNKVNKRTNFTNLILSDVRLIKDVDVNVNKQFLSPRESCNSCLQK